MALIPAKCTNCGANLIIDSSKDTYTCQYCDMAFVIEKTVNNYTINNINITPQTGAQQCSQKKRDNLLDVSDANAQDHAMLQNLDEAIEYYQYGDATLNPTVSSSNHPPDPIVKGQPYLPHNPSNTQSQPPVNSPIPPQTVPNTAVPYQYTGFKLFGFRSKKLWKMSLAIAYMIWWGLILLAFISMIEVPSDIVIWAYLLCHTISPFVFLSDSKLRESLPLFKMHKGWASILGLWCVDIVINIVLAITYAFLA